jgi:hypothetical protein
MLAVLVLLADIKATRQALVQFMGDLNLCAVIGRNA